MIAVSERVEEKAAFDASREKEGKLGCLPPECEKANSKVIKTREGQREGWEGIVGPTILEKKGNHHEGLGKKGNLSKGVEQAEGAGGREKTAYPAHG